MRKILHVDMDAFYASVEQRDDPALRGLPVAVGGASGRGVVCAASYEARPFGVRSAMPMAQARQLCPGLVVVPTRFEAYREASRAIHAVFRRYTDVVEPLSLDEAYLDVSAPLVGPPSGIRTAQAIRADIWAETGLTASAGVSFCKFLAKLASDMDKPDGLSVILPEDALGLLASLPVERFHGVGPATAMRLHGLGIRTGADLQARSEDSLRASLGKTGAWLARVARGLDDRPVRAHRERKSVGVERTFERDVRGADAIVERLVPVADELARRLASHGVAARTLTLKLKTVRFVQTTRSASLVDPVTSADDLLDVAVRLLARPAAPSAPLRLVGLTASALVPLGSAAQLALELEG